ncbi:hypothetical protein LTY36_01290 [Limosilactobacillus agrestis]|uniref:Uncharacterized protein n=1 Tax=Limosilactobacillus agrestis TaxID=2759748 RepID=A0A7W3YKN6_9LACO|nr:hypothetical protein [Limosilactobacillus agrestis]MBB1095208.1 hypothetical protein [Limosilactobacillus agrestis]MCD7129857.1 hypothetical protein [Limosilactobacillus agrestis]
MKTTKLIITLGGLALAGAIAYKASKRRCLTSIKYYSTKNSSDTSKSEINSKEYVGRHWVEDNQIVDGL